MLTATHRLLRLLSLLQTRSHWSGPELATTLEVHPRTLRRDIDKLRELGYPVHASSGIAGGYALRPGKAPAAAVAGRRGSAGGGYHAAHGGRRLGGRHRGNQLRALIKLEQVMPARLRRRTDALRAAVVPLEPHGPTVDAALLATLATACRDQLRVAFDYQDGRGQASSRMVEPQGVAHASQRWYLVAWDPARDDWRIFRLDRIAGPATTARTSRRVPRLAGRPARVRIAHAATRRLSGAGAHRAACATGGHGRLHPVRRRRDR